MNNTQKNRCGTADAFWLGGVWLLDPLCSTAVELSSAKPRSLFPLIGVN